MKAILVATGEVAKNAMTEIAAEAEATVAMIAEAVVVVASVAEMTVVVGEDDVTIAVDLGARVAAVATGDATMIADLDVHRKNPFPQASRQHWSHLRQLGLLWPSTFAVRDEPTPSRTSLAWSSDPGIATRFASAPSLPKRALSISVRLIRACGCLVKMPWPTCSEARC